MFKNRTPFELPFVLIKSDDLNFILGIFNKWAQWESEILLRLIAEINGV